MATSLKDQSLFRQQCYINGEWCNADSSKTIEVTNPVDGELIGTVPNMGTIETRRAIEAANYAGRDWRAKPAKERSDIIRRWYELVVENTNDLARLMTLEQGKPLHEAKGEIGYAASFLEWFSEEAKRVYGDIIPAPQQDKRIIVLKQPVGVVAAITAWNFPTALITRKAGPALAAGCTFIAKPASQTPFSALALAELAERAGVPSGVLNIITGSAGVIGCEMTENAVVRKLSFTGSTKVGKLLMAQCAETVKKVSMELGGNAPFIVFNDADIDAAVEGAMLSKFRNAGQTCVCANRILVQEEIYDIFAEKFTAAVAKLKVGNGLNDDTDQGPLIDENAVLNAIKHVNDALSKGAKLTVGGERHKSGGTFFEPTVLRDVTTDMLITHEETFAPVAPLYKFVTDDDGINMANATEFGLAAYFYTRDNARVWKVSEALESGIVGANTGFISTAVAPFGGVKESGIGREGSKYGLDEFCEIKYVCVGGV